MEANNVHHWPMEQVVFNDKFKLSVISIASERKFKFSSENHYVVSLASGDSYLNPHRNQCTAAAAPPPHV